MPENKDEANCKQIYFADRVDFKCFSTKANQQKIAKNENNNQLRDWQPFVSNQWIVLAHYCAFWSVLLPQAEKLRVISFLCEYAGTKQIHVASFIVTMVQSDFGISSVSSNV